MKKALFFVAALVILAGQIFAAPVDVNTAKTLGAKYLRNNVSVAKDVTEVEHVFTFTSDEGAPYLYIFNYEKGFVVVAADDRAHPILGYSDEGTFDANNIPEGMLYYMGHFGSQIQYAIDNGLVAEEDITSEWELLRKEGITTRTRMDKAVSPLLTTTWDQGYPYNYYAPSCTSYWTGNHCYAGCVACSMSQVMKYWNWPETGVGEHSYSTSSYGGTLSVNFGETTYNWSIMPNSLGSSANDAAKAVALLMYHCGVSVDMDYSPEGSGAHTEDVADAVKTYFRYGECVNVKSRDSYSRTQWEDLLIESFDKGFPVVYAGAESDGSGGHAFNCDGYNDQRYFHFNWGWSGSYNNYYQIDALNTGNGSFNSYQRVVFDMIPDYIYNAMVPAIETMTAEVADAITKTVELNWTVPEVSVSGVALESIDQIVLKRNGDIIQTFDNPQPGDVVSYEDEVAEYGSYEYTICGINNDYEGDSFTQIVIAGPNCTWKIVCTTTSFQGWNGGKVMAVGANGIVFNEFTMTSSSPMSEKFQIPEGDFSLQWYAPSTAISSLTITLKNSANETVYNFSGSSSQLSTTMYDGNNSCDNCTPPTNLTGENVWLQEGDGVLLTWNCDYTPSNFKIYRSEDGENYEEIAKIDNTATEYFDAISTIGTYYYKVTAYSSACESTPATTADDSDYVVVMVTGVGENSVNARVYPNPTKGNVIIEAENLNNVAVYNLVGQKIFEENIDGGECVINMREFGSGIYMISINTTKGSTTQKISVIE